MAERKFKEYLNYLAKNLKEETQVTDMLYQAGLKALKSNDFLILDQDDRKAALLPSIAEGDHILVYQLDGIMHMVYEKTKALKEKQPFRNAINDLMAGDNNLYGLNNLFKFRTKTKKGMSLYTEMVEGGSYNNMREWHSALLEDNPTKRKELFDKLAEPEGKCIGAMATLDTLKVFADSLTNLKLMKKLPTKFYKDLGKKCADNLESESQVFLDDINYMYEQAKAGKYTASKPFVVGDVDHQVWCPTMANTVCYKTNNIGYVIKKTDEDSWEVYPYSKEYCHHTTLKDVVTKIKNGTIDPVVDANLVIEKGVIKHSAALIYEMGIDLFCISREFKEQQVQLESQQPKSKIKM